MDLLDRDVKDMDGAVKASTADDEDRAATSAAMEISAVSFMALVELRKRVEAGGWWSKDPPDEEEEEMRSVCEGVKRDGWILTTLQLVF